MPIHPLPQFEADLAEHLQEQADREAYERLNAPKTIVVRFGHLKMVGEFPWKSDEKPGCGSKIVVRTHRGTEIGEMLTSTCPNSGCSKSVSRKEMLEYIENSGGRQYPFSTEGQALRVATREDLDEQSRLEQAAHGMRSEAKRLTEARRLPMKIVQVEPLLGGERTIVYFASEDRIDFRDLVGDLQQALGTRVDMRQIGARDEARVTADYERCGQYCCCKNFLKVLKPVSMKSAKIQKATLDPLKISGRCGRLMCCLRYEDETYDELRKRLPHRKSRVGTPEGDGIVIETQILTQLALIELDSGTRVAVPIEDLTEPGAARKPEVAPKPDARRGKGKPGSRASGESGDPSGAGDRKRVRARRVGPRPETAEGGAGAVETDQPDAPRKKKRRRRKKKPSDAQGGGEGHAQQASPSDASPEGAGQDSPAPGGDGPRKKRRRRRRRPGGGDGGASGGSADRSGDGSAGGPGD